MPNPPLVLLVEDYPANALVARTLLEALGFRVEEARNGEEAVSMVEAQAYDAVLMDVEMPEMDGLAATRLIRQREVRLGLPALPILGVTAHTMTAEIEKCRAAGMDDYLGKPLTLEQLQKKLALLLAPRQKTPGA